MCERERMRERGRGRKRGRETENKMEVLDYISEKEKECAVTRIFIKAANK